MSSEHVACVPLERLLEPVVTARVVVVAAHPDDETIGAGALLARSTDAHVVVVTDGAPREPALWPSSLRGTTREEYARIRREELRVALAEAGIGPERLHLLKVTDCEATGQIPTIVGRLIQLFEEIDPDIVLTHAYEGGHVDHDATARAVHGAMAASGRGHPHEMALYHRAEGGMAVHEFLPDGPPARTFRLDERFRARKSRMLERYVSQRQYEMYFRTDVERYRCAPAYDFGAFQTAAGQPERRDNAASKGDGIATAPLVSVVVRTIGRDTLVEALNSIACQTYPNIEIVLVDVSGDGPPAMWKDREGRLLRTVAGIGLDRPKAANAGLAAARGDYIAFLDDDDWFHSEHVASVVAALRASPDARVAYTGVEVVEWVDDGSPVRRWVFDAPYDPVALLCENYIPLNALLFERGLIDEGCQFDESFPVYEDWDFLIRLSRRTRFLKVPGISAVYRWPPGSGVNDPGGTAAAQARVFTKWRADLSPEAYVALLRRAIEPTALNDGGQAQIQALQTQLKTRDAELARLRPRVDMQETELDQLRTRLEAQDEELGRLRARVVAQSDDLRRLSEACAAAVGHLAAIQKSRSWRLTRPLRTLRSFASPVDRLPARLVELKVPLASGRRSSRWLVPVVEALEVLLTKGPREVAVRVRRRLLTRPVTPPPEYFVPHIPSATLSPLRRPPMSVASECVSIVIPVLDNAEVTHRCLSAIATHTTPGTYEVIVVDNASGEKTRRMLSRVQGLRVIRNGVNAGFVEACNQGAAAAHGEYVVFLNNDTAVLPGWLDALVGTVKKRPDAGAVGARLLFPDGRLQEAGSIVWNDGLGWNYGKFADPEAPEFGYLRDVDYCSGACLLVPRHLFDSLGGFDLRYAPAYYEDADFCFRLREHGYSVLYQPAARVVHIEGGTAGRNDSAGFKHYQRVNHQKFVERHQTALRAQSPPDPERVRLARDRRPGCRILVLDHIVPHHDRDAGSLRMAAILHILVDLGHAVTFLPDNLARIEPYATELQQLGIEVLYGPMSARKWLEAHISEFDVAILCRAYFAAKHLATVQAATPRPFVIFDTVDLHYLREERRAALEHDEALRDRAAKTRALELAVMRESDMIWVTSTHEADVLRGSGMLATVEVVPTIHRVRMDTPGFADRRNMLFIGGFLHPPNEDAVVYFVERVLPLVTARLLDVQLLVVGSNMSQRVQNLASDHVMVVGHVGDVRPLFDSCRLSVAPLRYGAGVKGKITQSLAWGLPVVTTPIGAEGLDLVDREHVMIASDATEMAQRIVETYQDEAVWQRLSENGRQYLQAHLGYESVRAHIGGLLQRVNKAAPAAKVG